MPVKHASIRSDEGVDKDIGAKEKVVKERLPLTFQHDLLPLPANYSLFQIL